MTSPLDYIPVAAACFAVPSDPRLITLGACGIVTSALILTRIRQAGRQQRNIAPRDLTPAQ
jgi:hypothetical protein